MALEPVVEGGDRGRSRAGRTRAAAGGSGSAPAERRDRSGKEGIWGGRAAIGRVGKGEGPEGATEGGALVEAAGNRAGARGADADAAVEGALSAGVRLRSTVSSAG